MWVWGRGEWGGYPPVMFMYYRELALDIIPNYMEIWNESTDYKFNSALKWFILPTNLMKKLVQSNKQASIEIVNPQYYQYNNKVATGG